MNAAQRRYPTFYEAVIVFYNPLFRPYRELNRFSKQMRP